MRYVLIPEDDYYNIIDFISIITDYVNCFKFVPLKYRKLFKSEFNRFYENYHYYERVEK